MLKDRIKRIRTELGLTQEKFASKIGLARNSIANYEIGRREPTNSVIVSICREFNVNEEWLRNGTGEMFIEVDQEELNCNIADIFASLNTDDWKLLIHTAQVLYNKRRK